MVLLDGKALSAHRKAQLAQEARGLKPALAIVLVGENPASLSYIAMKRRMCESLGFGCTVHHLPEHATEKKVEHAIDALNADPNVTGILIQLPLPPNLPARALLDRVLPAKDVDGLHSEHLGKVLLNEEAILPATPRGIFELLAAYNLSVQGKVVCVVGFSDVVGKPLATACLNRGATVTICNRNTKDLKSHTFAADIIMTATGVPNLITADHVREGATVIDIGITKVDGVVHGDVDFAAVRKKAAYITPVPGGVGPMTIIALMENLIALTKKNG